MIYFSMVHIYDDSTYRTKLITSHFSKPIQLKEIRISLQLTSCTLPVYQHYMRRAHILIAEPLVKKLGKSLLQGILRLIRKTH